MYRVENDQTIEMTIKSMQNGYFNSFQDSLNIDTCSICTDRFNEYSLISLTNEWGHVFHTACLKAYYQSSSTPHYLCCPNCGCVNNNTQNSRIQVNESSQVSLNGNPIFASTPQVPSANKRPK